MLKEIYVSGCRAEDMALRLKYAGFPTERLHIQKNYPALIEQMTANELPVIVMPTYPAMLEVRGTISKRYGYREFWQ